MAYTALPLTPEGLYQQDQLKMRLDMCWRLRNELRYESVEDIRARREKQKRDKERREEIIARRSQIQKEYRKAKKFRNGVIKLRNAGCSYEDIAEFYDIPFEFIYKLVVYAPDRLNQTPR